jgi:molybdate transport system regulatory protein
VEHAKLSARNVLAGEVARLEPGAVNSEVEIRLPGGTPVVASITKASVQALDLKQGDKVSAIIKASHVLVGV